MRRLVYSTAFGNDFYFHLAEEMIKALLKTGYDGEIVILTDRHWNFQSPARACIVKPEKFWKNSILQAVKVEDYDKILFLDSDIIPYKSLDPIFALNGLNIAIEDFPLASNVMNKMFLTDPEIEGAGERNLNSVNAGTFLVPGIMARFFFKSWDNALDNFSLDDAPDLWQGVHKNGKEKANKEWYDQSILQAMCLRGLPWNGMDLETVLMPALFFNTIKLSEKTFLIHFNGLLQVKQNKDLLLSWMRLCNEGKFAEACAQAKLCGKTAHENRPKHELERLTRLLSNLLTAMGEWKKDIDSRMAALEAVKELV